MPNIASVLKTEIARIARKEIRTEIDALKKVSAQQRTTIAALRRQLTTLEKKLRDLARQKPRKAAEAAAQPEADEQRPRFSPSWLAAHRAKLGLSAAQYGQLAGVSTLSIYRWEQGRAKPRRAQLLALARVRALGRREAAELLASS